VEQTFTSTKPNLNADTAQEREPVRYARAQASVSICEDKELALPGCPQGNPLQLVPEKHPTSIAIGWGEPVLRAGVAPSGVERL